MHEENFQCQNWALIKMVEVSKRLDDRWWPPPVRMKLELKNYSKRKHLSLCRSLQKGIHQPCRLVLHILCSSVFPLFFQLCFPINFQPSPHPFRLVLVHIWMLFMFFLELMMHRCDPSERPEIDGFLIHSPFCLICCAISQNFRPIPLNPLVCYLQLVITGRFLTLRLELLWTRHERRKLIVCSSNRVDEANPENCFHAMASSVNPNVNLSPATINDDEKIMAELIKNQIIIPFKRDCRTDINETSMVPPEWNQWIKITIEWMGDLRRWD